MTEFWKSNPMFWCEYCKVWLQDNPGAKATHERGTKHQENVARKLREMRQKQDSEKKERELAAKTFGSIEEAARKQYEADLKEAEAKQDEVLGEWVDDSSSGYMYNAVQRYYYDRKTGMYYGGDPATWTKSPAIPPAARVHKDDADKDGEATTSGVGGGGKTVVKKKLVAPKHPMAELGGYQMPSVGRVGGAKQMGAVGVETAAKRKREDGNKSSGKPVDPKEAEAQARREAARQRVQQRTLKSFGLG